MRQVAIIVLFAALVTGCSSTEPAGTSPVVTSPGAAAPQSSQRFPDIVDVMVSRSGDRYSFAVTVSSPYDTPNRYADAFRVRSTDGMVFGVNELDHDHATEQPFTRTLAGLAVPSGVTTVVVEGRDQANGWGGGTKTVDLPP